jgi:hypothetical protein
MGSETAAGEIEVTPISLFDDETDLPLAPADSTNPISNPNSHLDVIDINKGSIYDDADGALAHSRVFNKKFKVRVKVRVRVRVRVKIHYHDQLIT